MTNTVTKIEANFGRSLGNGANMGKYTLEAFKTVLDKRDTTILVAFLQQAKKREDTLAERAIKFMINIVYNGATIKTEKNKKTGKSHTKIIIKGIKANDKAIQIMGDLVEAKISMRGTKWKDAFTTKTTKKSAPLNVKSFIDTCSKRSTDELKEMQKIIKAAIKHQENNVVVELPNKKAA
tara:strand:- start:3550 stop:4089 length:540 start_codon:yes stop_codon:yes gene_type:complete